MRGWQEDEWIDGLAWYPAQNSIDDGQIYETHRWELTEVTEPMSLLRFMLGKILLGTR